VTEFERRTDLTRRWSRSFEPNDPPGCTAAQTPFLMAVFQVNVHITTRHC